MPTRFRFLPWTLPLLLLASAVHAGPRTEILRQGPDGFTLRVQVPDPIRTPVEPEEGGVYLRVTVPGMGSPSSEDAGAPDLPRQGFPFAVPQGAVAEIAAVRVLREESFRGAAPLPVPRYVILDQGPVPVQEAHYEPDRTLYDGAGRIPASTVELGPIHGWRFNRVQSLIVRPISVVPASGQYRAIREMEIDVRFRTREASPDEAVRRVAVRRDEPGWETLLDRTLINGESAAGFRQRPAPRSLAGPIEPGQSYVRLRVGGTGVARIPYAVLRDAGFPSGTPIAQVRLEERSFDPNLADPYLIVNLPRDLEDANLNGTFDEGDHVVFHAMNFQDRFPGAPVHDQRYTYHHTYWMTASPAGGLDYPEVDGFPAGTYQLQTSFSQTRRFEENRYYANNPPGQSVFYPPRESFYWLDSRDTREEVDFDLPGVAPGGTVSVFAVWPGKDSAGATVNHYVSLELNGTPILEDRFFTSRNVLSWQSPVLGADGLINSGSNRMVITAHTENLAFNFSGTWFDYFELTYRRSLVADNDYLLFTTTGASGMLEYSVAGFTSPDIVVLDVTDPAAPFRLTGPVSGSGSDHRVGIRLTAGIAPRVLVAFVPDRFEGLPSGGHVLGEDLQTEIEPGLTRDLLQAGNGNDYILITHPEFQSAWDPLVQHRELQGHRVFVCNVHEIYDQFNGGDKSPWAIRDFLKMAFQTWDPAPSFVLLGGDGNEDYRGDLAYPAPGRPLALSNTDWIPTMMHYANVQGGAGLEVAGTDNWYVGPLAAGDSSFDVFPEMHIGRLPAGDAAEVQAMIDKILIFESTSPGSEWRNRGVFVADDSYSTAISFNSGYCYRGSERVFRATTEAVCDSIRLQGGHLTFECDTLFLDAYLDTAAVLRRNPGNFNDCPKDDRGIPLIGVTARYTQDNVQSVLMSKLNRGCLIWEYTGHANKHQIATEELVKNYAGFAVNDIDRVLNIGKPFIFMGFACHLAEFENADVGSGGDSIGEELLDVANRGAVAVIASTGFEWLHTNPDAQLRTSRPVFWRTPRDPDTGRPRRLLGESHTEGLVGLALDNPGADSEGMLRTYIHLGDPALRVDFRGVEFQVTLDGTPLEDRARLVVDTADSVEVQVVASDDVDLMGSIRVREDGVEIPSERITVIPPDPSAGGAQAYSATFQIQVRPGNYDLVVEATDWTGRATRFTAQVRTETLFRAEGRILDPAQVEVVDPLAPISLELTTPVPVTASDLNLLLDGTEISGSLVPLDNTNRRWAATADRVPWADGEHTLALSLAATQEDLGTLRFSTSNTTLALLGEPYAYPNPYEVATPSALDPLYLVFELSRRPVKARVQIYTVKGRRVLRTDVPAVSGRNSFRWDLRDDSGDLVANGVYLLVLDVEGEGVNFRHTERLAVAR